ncbi:glycosyltransferase family 1 protein [Komagataeibacter sp. FNDCR2]|uniref:glycosyltransferase family 4 protein n=1 Tax=Komagataeibacter sp. FNDCR2 TaxID=2878682 RepID=UPI001E61ADFA|nr:glycosyltransferase family 1 protein [Komagataeibacter sp. FNDCR2]MCE2576851.1 glycosyltransferase family 4 protein [Komagataeibacter sp. FNDCR2]
MNNLENSKKYRVCIDGFNLSLMKGTGIATYARTLSHIIKCLGHPVDVLYGLNIHKDVPDILKEVMFFESLSKTEKKTPGKEKIKQWIRYKVLSEKKENCFYINLTGRVNPRDFIERMPAYDHILNSQNIFEKAGRHFRITGKFLPVEMVQPPRIMHWTYPFPIEVKGAINIYTIHDLIPLRFPHTTLDNKNYYYNLINKISNMDVPICTVSESSKKDIISFFPNSNGKIYNSYQSSLINNVSTDDIMRPENEIKSLFNLDAGSYFMFYGSIEPKKNIGRIIEGFLKSKTKRKLVIVGAMSWKSDNELRLMDYGIKTGRIIFIEYLPQNILYSLLLNARCLLFPSIAEGFGLPIIESMSIGTPVLTSNEGSLPEVSGDSAIIVNAYDSSSIASGINSIDSNDELYEKLKVSGYAQAENFSMDAYKKRICIIYDKILRKWESKIN